MKKYLILAVILLAPLAFTACTKKTNEDGVNKQNFDKQGRRMPDFGQPERNPDSMGLVTKVLGNEITILKIERPERSSGDEDSEENDSKEDKKTLSSGANTRMPGMGMRGAGRGERNSEDFDEEAMIERMKEMSTGEITFTVPVGIQMLKSDTESEEAEMIEANLSDIETNSMITVWLNENIEDRRVAEFVLVR